MKVFLSKGVSVCPVKANPIMSSSAAAVRSGRRARMRGTSTTGRADGAIGATWTRSSIGLAVGLRRREDRSEARDRGVEGRPRRAGSWAGMCPRSPRCPTAYRTRPAPRPADAYQDGRIVKTVVQGRPFGAWRVRDITRDMSKRSASSARACRGIAIWRCCGRCSTGRSSRASSRRRRSRSGRSRPSSSRAKRRGRGGCSPARRSAPPGREPVAGSHHRGARDRLPPGELLSLQWDQVRGDLFLPAGKTKAKKPRRVPISSVCARSWRRDGYDPAGDPLPPEAYVFGDELGRRRRSIKTAWRLTVTAPDDRRASALPRSATGSRLALDGCGRPARDDSALARASQHQPDLDVSGGERRRRCGGDAGV